MMENFPNLRRKKVTQIQETQRVTNKRKPTNKRPTHRKQQKKVKDGVEATLTSIQN